MNEGEVFILEIIRSTQSQRLEVTGIEVRGISGSFFVARGHAPLVSLLQPAQRMILLLPEGTKQEIVIPGGIISVEEDRAVILVND